MGPVRSLSTATSRRVVAGQSVLDAAAVVKELVENALDAGASKLEVRLRGPAGLTAVQVSDNGSGLMDQSSDGLKAMLARNSTSKVRGFDEIRDGTVTTFGFRGEALSMIAELSASIQVTTACKDQAIGLDIRYDHKGDVTETQPCPRTQGTTVIVHRLFERYPVRRSEATSHAKRDLARVITTMQSFAFACPSTRFALNNDSTALLLTRPVSDSSGNSAIDHLKAAAVSILGGKQAAALRPLVAKLHDLPGWSVKCLLGGGRSSNDRHYFSIQGRIIDFPKLSRALTEAHRQANTPPSATVLPPTTFPVAIVAIRCPEGAVEHNTSPDKRTLLIECEKQLISAIVDETEKAGIWSPEEQTLNRTQQASVPQDTHVYAVQHALESGADGTLLTSARVAAEVAFNKQRGTNAKALIDRSAPLRAGTDDYTSRLEGLRRGCINNPRCDNKTTEQNITQDPISQATKNCQSEAQAVPIIQKVRERLSEKRPRATSMSLADLLGKKRTRATREEEKLALVSDDAKHSTSTTVEDGKDSATPKSESRRLGESSTAEASERLVNVKESVCDYPKVPNVAPTRLIEYEAGEVLDFWKTGGRGAGIVGDDSSSQVGQHATKDIEDPKAEDELGRVFSKSSFKEMNVVAQFNLGFIICQLGQDLFIVDQHAADEKFNFEDLQRNTLLQVQSLLQPIALELSAEEECLVLENLSAFKAGGFDIHVNHDAEPTNRLSLKSIPYTKNILFGLSDVQEMLGTLRDLAQKGQASPTVLTPQRVRAINASRACRKSVMIGTALELGKLEMLVRNLERLDHPWQCPHGRPTMRHLLSFRSSSSSE